MSDEPVFEDGRTLDEVRAAHPADPAAAVTPIAKVDIVGRMREPMTDEQAAALAAMIARPDPNMVALVHVDFAITKLPNIIKAADLPIGAVAIGGKVVATSNPITTGLPIDRPRAFCRVIFECVPGVAIRPATTFVMLGEGVPVPRRMARPDGTSHEDALRRVHADIAPNGMGFAIYEVVPVGEAPPLPGEEPT